MGLYDAMNASVTGMAAQSNYLANIGQNIANADTVGYKEADTEFSTLVDQAAVGQTSAGGVTTDTRLDISQQGTLESTTSSTDLAVSGNGFFVVSNASGQEFLTRAGSFVPDASGNLVNAGRLLPDGLQPRQRRRRPWPPIRCRACRSSTSTPPDCPRRPTTTRNLHRQPAFDRHGGRGQPALDQFRQLDL